MNDDNSSSSIELAQQQWQTTLAQLQLQMTSATFDSHLAGTWLISINDGNKLEIGVVNESSLAWLQNRLIETIARTAAAVFERPVELQFVLAGPPQEAEGPAPEEIPLPSAPSLDQIKVDFYRGKTEMGRWIRELQYDNLFWLPYLGKAYYLHRHLQVHWVKSLQSKEEMALLDLSNPDNHWTPIFGLSYRQATKWLGNSNPITVPGGMRECHNSDIHNRVGQPLAECCQTYEPHDWRPGDGGCGRCYYWTPGLIHRLYDERLLAIDISATRAKVQVWQVLPFLTPVQVATLDKFLQTEHGKWLERYGLRFFDLSLNEWERWPPSIITRLPGYDRRELFGEPPPNPLLAKRAE